MHDPNSYDRLLFFALVVAAITVAWVFVTPAGGAEVATGATTIDFAREIAPILERRCLECHGRTEPQGGLQLDTREHAFQGSNSGIVIQPGDSSKSRLVKLIEGRGDDGSIMPPEGEPLAATEIARLRRWIDQGAAWPADIVLKSPESAAARQRDHWSLRPLARPSVPRVASTAVVRNAIDSFILARLEQEAIPPSPEASKATLIRRLSLDLLGLPPSPAEVDAFLSDAAADAYDRLVDRLLASPHYGERWARPWLDLCHYGDTDGYLQDFPRPIAWRYRDWVVQALNRDMPFDQFTIEQLAGDILPEATTDQFMATGFLRQTFSNREGGADLEEYRVEQVVDRVQMVGTTWLGLTVGCARCHDHKYDPFSQRDFYRLYAIFDSADEVNVDAPLAGQAEPHYAKRQVYEQKRRELLQPWRTAIAELQSRWEHKLRTAAAQPGLDQTWDREWEVLGLVWGQGQGEGQLEGTQIVLLAPARRTPEQQEKLEDYFLASGQVVDPNREFPDFRPRELAAKISTLRAELPPLARAQAVRETRNPRAVHVHRRGDFRRPGVAVSPGLPAVFRVTDEAAVPSVTNRLQFARWLVSRENPLTARVVVNRTWQEFFGTGISHTSDDLGRRGELPSHPELLDWLAVDFIESGWSLKQLHRTIVRSATYRQSSQQRPELAIRDPQNRLLARQSGLRLSADQIRDSALAVSGLLDRTIGGPSVRPPQPISVAMESFSNEWTAGGANERYRRGLYTFVQRTSPFAQGVTFDAPAPGRACTRRERSNTPLQALTLLNDPAFVEAAQALARHVAASGGSTADQVTRAFQACLGRAPTSPELARLVAAQEQQCVALQAAPELAAKLAPEPVPGVDRQQLAAQTALCSVLLNLHEFITRE